MLANPEAPPAIDWAFYKQRIAVPGLVDSFQKQYEALKVPYPENKVSHMIDAQKVEVVNNLDNPLFNPTRICSSNQLWKNIHTNLSNTWHIYRKLFSFIICTLMYFWLHYSIHYHLDWRNQTICCWIQQSHLQLWRSAGSLAVNSALQRDDHGRLCRGFPW